MKNDDNKIYGTTADKKLMKATNLGQLLYFGMNVGYRLRFGDKRNISSHLDT